MQKTLIILFSLIALALGLFFGNSFFDIKKTSSQSGQYVDPPGGDFTLQSKSGPVSLSDHKGKVVMIYFGYTSCPDVCPTSLSRIAAGFKKLSANELAGVHGILISVDPERDTVEKLADYTKYFHPQIDGVTGSKAQIDEIAKRYDVKYRKAEGSSATGYLVDHTGYIFVLDTKGKISEFLPHAVSAERVVEVIRKLQKS